MINAIARNLFTKKDYTKEDIPGIQTPISKFFDSVKSNIPECSELKKNFARYTFVFWILSARQLCPRLQHIYPDLESLQISGHLTNPERVKLEKYEKNGPESLHLLVYHWIRQITKQIAELGYFLPQIDNVGECSEIFKKRFGTILKSESGNKLSPFLPCLRWIRTIVMWACAILSIISKFQNEDLLTIESWRSALLTSVLHAMMILFHYCYCYCKKKQWLMRAIVIL